MEANYRYALRRLFFLGQFRAARLILLMAQRRMNNPDPWVFFGRVNPENLSPGEVLVVQRVKSADIGELATWGDLPHGSPALIFKVNIQML